MSIKNAYLNEVYQGLAKRNAEQKEFLQAVEEVLESLEPVVEAHPEYEKASLIERLVGDVVLPVQGLVAVLLALGEILGLLGRHHLGFVLSPCDSDRHGRALFA